MGAGSSRAPDDPRIGSVLQKKYEIVRFMGQGGMGRVYEARHRTTTRRVAIKFVAPQYQASDQILERFVREARTAGGIEHLNIAAVLDFGQAEDGVPYLVLEYLEGENCQKLLAREGALPVPRALNIVIQVCEGLAAAHEAGAIHRDLKPANLFICARRRSDETELVKILDFGVAKLKEPGAASADTPSGASLGTPQYMSPEQARGAKDLDHRSDIYALGVIFYELLSGEKAHGGSSPLEIIFNILHAAPKPLQSLRPELPAGLVALVERAMSTDRERRFRSALELREALAEFRWSGSVAQRESLAPSDAATQTIDATLVRETGEEKAGDARSNAQPSEPVPTFVPVEGSHSAAPKASGSRWLRALAFALVAIGAGSVGGLIAGQRSGLAPDQSPVTAAPSGVVRPLSIPSGGHSVAPSKSRLSVSEPAASVGKQDRAAAPVRTEPSRPPKRRATAARPSASSSATRPSSTGAAPPPGSAKATATPAELEEGEERWLDRRQ